MTFIQAVTAKFKTGDQSSAFVKEYKMLTADDKRDLYHGLKREFPDIEPPADANGPIDCSSNPRNY